MEQKEYIKNFIDDFETTLYASNTPDQQESLSKFIDVGSFIDYFLINELARNVDGYKKSCFFHKDKDSKGGLLHAGPVWDFDWAWKNIDECYFGATNGSGWAYQVQKCNPWPVPPGWMPRLLQDPGFSRQVNERYFDLRKSILSEDFIFHYIDSVAAVLDKAQNRHFSKWPILGINVGTPETDAQPTTYAGEVEKFKQWISMRLNWLDANMHSVITGIDESPKNNTCVLYPNPVSSELRIDSKKAVGRVAVYSPDGKSLISRNNPTSSVGLDLRQFSPGLYFVKVYFADGSEWREKFIKAK